MAVREWARRDVGVAERLRDVDNQRMNLLRRVLADRCADEDELEARCLIAFSVAIGSRLLHADHVSRSREQVLETVTRMIVDPVTKPESD